MNEIYPYSGHYAECQSFLFQKHGDICLIGQSVIYSDISATVILHSLRKSGKGFIMWGFRRNSTSNFPHLSSASK